jgi:lipoprotein-anchoring transpeptidase ErfK/SrfK
VNTLKSAALVVVLLGVLYGVYVVLSKPHVLGPVGPEAQPGEDLGPPLVDFSGAGSSVPHDHAGHAHHDHDSAKAATVAPSSGGAYQPNLDSPATLPPPSSSAPPSDPSLAGASGATRQSSYEAPAPAGSAPGGSFAGAPPLETTPPPAAPAASPTPDPAADAARTAALTAWSLRRDLQAAEQLVAEGGFREALIKLSPYYRHPDLSAEDQSQLIPWLDALAAKVIYSREHLLAAPYEVRRNETLEDIARRHQVPWMVLAAINSDVVSDPQVLVPGTQLKVVPGPFRADVSLTAGELTLLLGDMYAGRFPFALGADAPQPGAYKVNDKLTSRTYYAADGRTIPANDPSNPYGNVWIDLGREACIHGSPVTSASLSSSGQTAALGCISLSPQDARDVFGILTVGSEVTIRR